MNKVVEPLKAAWAKTLHTEAPWRVAGKATGHVHGKDVLVAIIGNYRDRELLRFNKDRWDADARLIAAAPELLAICKIFLGHDERFQVAVGGNPIAVDKMLDHARAVLLQATEGSGSTND